MINVFRLRQCWTLPSLSVVLAVVLTLGLTSLDPVQGADFTLKLGHATANDAQDKTSIFFTKEVERFSKGRIKATVYNASQLGNNPKMNKDVRSGVQEALAQPTGFAVPYIRTLGVLDLPFLFPNERVQTQVLNSEATDPFRALARKAGVEIVAFFGGGFKHFITKFPLKTAADLQGRKFRVIQSPELVAQFKAFGAIGVPMPLMELYTSLQQRVVEGCELPWDLAERLKYYEVAKYLTESRHGSLSSFIIVNKRWLDSLPKDLQEAVREAGRSTAKEAVRIYRESEQNSLKVLQKKGLVSALPEVERAKLKAASEQVWTKIRKNPAKAEALSRLEKAIAAAR